VLSALPPDFAGVGIAVTTSLRMVAGALGVALLPAVLSSVFTGRVADAAGTAVAGLPAGAATQATATASESVAGAALVADRLGPAGAGLRAAAFDAFTAGMSLIFLLSAAVALLGAVLVARFLPRAAAVRPTPPPDRVPAPV
jgi:DHA2 family multidrug resistance protein-like MFS transporter